MAMAIAIAAGAANRAEPLRVLVLVEGDAERQLAARVEGQTTDLDAVIITVEGPKGIGAEAKAQRARAEGVTHRAEVAVWFISEGDGWIVNVAHGKNLLQRRVAESSGAMSTSASTEAAALTVRTALRGIATGADEVPESVAPTLVRFWGGLGWTGVLDGSGTPGHHGGEARAGAAFDRWRLALEVGYHPGQTIRSTEASIDVDRLGLGLVGGYDLAGTERWRVGVELGAAAARYSRATTFVAPGLAATSPTIAWSPALRPAFTVALHLGGVMWVAVSLGADVLLARPRFEVKDASGFKPVSTLWAVEPRASLTLVIDVL